MNKLLPFLAFSILLLVPLGSQQVFANHPQLVCPPLGTLTDNTGFASPNFGGRYCISEISPNFQLTSCPPGYALETLTFFGVTPFLMIQACTADGSQQTPDPTHPDQCQDKATLVGNHCVPDLNQVCGSGTIPQNMMCVAQQMGSMIGGLLLDIDTTALLIASIGTNPIITGLVGITLAGVAGQVAWFVHRRKKSRNS